MNVNNPYRRVLIHGEKWISIGYELLCVVVLFSFHFNLTIMFFLMIGSLFSEYLERFQHSYIILNRFPKLRHSSSRKLILFLYISDNFVQFDNNEIGASRFAGNVYVRVLRLYQENS